MTLASRLGIKAARGRFERIDCSCWASGWHFIAHEDLKILNVRTCPKCGALHYIYELQRSGP
jgi:hypothetical protein